MGQKINPLGFRIGVSKDWSSRWYADKKSRAASLFEDYKIRKFLMNKYEAAGVKSVEIERSLNELSITVKVSRPGIVIGKGGIEATNTKNELKKLTKSKISLTVEEVKVPEVEAKLVAEYISRQLKRRLPYRRVIASAMNSAMDRGAKGIKIRIAGLLSGGNTISRVEKFSKGSVPNQTLRADIDYAQVDCHMIYGTIGIKVWIHRGELEI